MSKVLKNLIFTLTLFFMVFTTPLQALAASILGDYETGLLLHYTLDESSGIRYDSYGSNDLTDNNTVGQNASCVQDACADFESTNSEFLSITDGSQTGLDINDNFSISMWITPESISNAPAYMTTWNKFGSTNNQRGYRLSLSANTQIFQISTTGSNVSTGAWSTTISAGTLYHVVLTYDKSAGSAILYLDASSQGTKTGLYTSIKNTTEPFIIGKSTNPNEYYFDGTIDEVTIWVGRILTPSEVTAIYNSGAGIPYEETATRRIISWLGLWDLHREPHEVLFDKIESKGWNVPFYQPVNI